MVRSTRWTACRFSSTRARSSGLSATTAPEVDLIKVMSGALIPDADDALRGAGGNDQLAARRARARHRDGLSGSRGRPQMDVEGTSSSAARSPASAGGIACSWIRRHARRGAAAHSVAECRLEVRAPECRRCSPVGNDKAWRSPALFAGAVRSSSWTNRRPHSASRIAWRA